eukprot:381788-Rhodomonas_salina.3
MPSRLHVSDLEISPWAMSICAASTRLTGICRKAAGNGILSRYPLPKDKRHHIVTNHLENHAKFRSSNFRIFTVLNTNTLYPGTRVPGYPGTQVPGTRVQCTGYPGDRNSSSVYPGRNSYPGRSTWLHVDPVPHRVPSGYPGTRVPGVPVGVLVPGYTV